MSIHDRFSPARRARGELLARAGDHRALPGGPGALGAAAAAAPGAVRGGLRHARGRRVLRRGAGHHQGPGRRGGHVLHHVQAPADRRLAGQRLHQHHVRRARRRGGLRGAVRAPRRRPRRDHRRRHDHARARRVPGRLRLRAGGDGQLRVLRPGRPRVGGRPGRAAAGGRAAAADPRRAAVHAQGDVAPAGRVRRRAARARSPTARPVRRRCAACRWPQEHGIAVPGFDPDTPIGRREASGRTEKPATASAPSQRRPQAGRRQPEPQKAGGASEAKNDAAPRRRWRS